MSERIVATQAELNKALADKVDWIEIRSPRGVWIEVGSSGSSTVAAYGSSTVTAYGSSRVAAYGSSTVTAYDSSTVTACDSSTVTAYGSSRVAAYGSSTVAASPKVAVHVHRSTVSLTGGVAIDHTGVDDMDGKEWCEYHGVEVKRGIATLFKAVNDQWTTDRGFDYSPGAKPEAPDWRDNNECGNGLHFGPTPSHALRYFESATKFLAVGVRVSELRQIPGSVAKAKAPAVVRACVEVDVAGNAVTS